MDHGLGTQPLGRRFFLTQRPTQFRQGEILRLGHQRWLEGLKRVSEEHQQKPLR
jgi:hypothetical protein